MSDPVNSDVTLSQGGPPETVMPAEPPEAVRTLQEAMNWQGEQRYMAVSSVLYRWPSFLAGWAHLGECAATEVEAYAAFRVGYHRGLDRLRQTGWRGSGFVRWNHPSNQGFLHSLDGLRRTCEALGEIQEAQRCAQFLYQLDPEWDPSNIIVH